MKVASPPDARSRALTGTRASGTFRRLPFGVRFAVVALVVFAIVAARHLLGR